MNDVVRMSDYRLAPKAGLYLPEDVTAGTGPEPVPGEGSQRSDPEEPSGQPAASEQVGEPVAAGRTERVQALEREVAEREELAELYEQYAATHVPSKTALAMREESRDAEAKRAEKANPARMALRDSRAQTVTNLVGLIAAVIALGWSTANVQHTAAMHTTGSAAWWLAWGVEPLISAALLTVMGARAYLATRGVTVTSRWVTAAQWVPLGYTVTLNCWTSLPSQALTNPAVEFLRGLVVHSVGPVVVVLLVHALPVLWAEFIRLHARESGEVPNRSEQERSSDSEIDEDRARALLAIVRPAVEAGQCSTGVSKIGSYLRGQGYRAGVPMCQWIRDALKREKTREGAAA